MGNQSEPTSAESQFGRRLRLLRESRGWSQQALAEQVAARTGVPMHLTAVSKIEWGARQVRLDEAVIIAALFDTTVEAMTSPDADEIAAALRQVEANIGTTTAELAELTELRDRLTEQLTEGETDNG